MPLLKKTIPEDLLCPITKVIMIDPVIAADGNTYERSAIEEWLRSNKTSPVNTTQKLAHTEVIPNRRTLRKIQKFKNENNICTVEEFIDAIERSDLNTLQNINFLESYFTIFHREREYPYHGIGINKHYPVSLQALHIAVENEDIKVLEYLLANSGDKYINTYSKTNACGGNFTPFSIALIDKQNPELLNLLLKYMQAKDINRKVQHKFGVVLPLFNAIRKGQKNIVDLLLNAGADVNIEYNDNTVLHIMWNDKKTPFTLQYFIDRGLNLAEPSFNGIMEAPVDRLAYYKEKLKKGNKPTYKKHIEDCITSIRELIKHGANINEKNIHKKKPRSCLGKAAMAQDIDIDLIQILLELGADPKIAMRDYTALHIATSPDKIELFAKYIDINNAENKKKWTPLHYLVRAGLNLYEYYESEKKENNIECIKKIIELGVNLFAKDAKGRTAKDIVAEYDSGSERKMFNFLDQLEEELQAEKKQQELIAKSIAPFKEEIRILIDGMNMSLNQRLNFLSKRIDVLESRINEHLVLEGNKKPHPEHANEDASPEGAVATHMHKPF